MPRTRITFEKREPAKDYQITVAIAGGPPHYFYVSLPHTDCILAHGGTPYVPITVDQFINDCRGNLDALAETIKCIVDHV